MKLRTITIVLVLAIVCALPLAAQVKSGVIGSPHDIGYLASPPTAGAGCKGCHAPHNGSLATGGSQTTGTILLWARAFTAETFGRYTSPTLDNPTVEVGATTPLATEARLYSFLCMSCHDGVTSLSLIVATDAAAVGNPTNSAGLTNDHPVNMTHDETQDTGLKTPTQVTTAGLKLYGTNTVQCASCHDAHNNTNTPFLRIANTSSALCLACHK